LKLIGICVSQQKEQQNCRKNRENGRAFTGYKDLKDVLKYAVKEKEAYCPIHKGRRYFCSGSTGFENVAF
jgi:hypothetical protein